MPENPPTPFIHQFHDPRAECRPSLAVLETSARSIELEQARAIHPLARRLLRDMHTTLCTMLGCYHEMIETLDSPETQARLPNVEPRLQVFGREPEDAA